MAQRYLSNQKMNEIGLLLGFQNNFKLSLWRNVTYALPSIYLERDEKH